MRKPKPGIPRTEGLTRTAVVALALALIAAGLAAVTAFAADGEVPVSTGPPQVVGQPLEGTQLTATQGGWDNDPASFAYQWQRCGNQADEGTCADIPGATTALYLLVEDDVGTFVRVQVIASNDVGDSDPALSAATAEIAGATAPGLVTGPTVIGSSPPEVGEELAADPGTWSGEPAPTFTYQWLRCISPDVEHDCSAIPTATAAKYTPTQADLGGRIAIAVTAHNVEGTAGPFRSAATEAVVASTHPVALVPPVITGSLTVGETLTSTSGSWTTVFPPLSFSFQWRRCDDQGQNCADIPGATQAAYVLQAEDAGYRIVVVVTAKDATGQTADATSSPTGAIGSGPVSISRPTISGSAAVGQLLSASQGTWENQNQLVFSYQWRRCNLQGEACQTISGATQATYRPTSEDIGHRIVVVVTAKDPGGMTQSATSLPTQAVAGIPPGQTIPASQIALPERLMISGYEFSPAILRSRAPFVARFFVTDTQGHPVSGADVYLVAIPYGRVAPPGIARTDTSGWATFTLQPTRRFPLIKGYLITIFARATKPGGDLLAGVSTRRLVSVRINPNR